MRCVGLWSRACRKELLASTLTSISGHGGSLLLHTCSVNRAHSPWEGGNVTVSLPRASDSVPPLRNPQRNYKATLDALTGVAWLVGRCPAK